MIGTALGGLGLFLLGMHVMTGSLTALAGGTLRALLLRATRSVWRGVAFGAIATAVLQSSSAVTLLVLGFVSAGLLPFGRALGVIYGANLGTTATAWIVAAIGLKVPLDAYAMPLVGLGAVLGVLGRGRASHVGLSMAGFGMVFVGIGALQEGMSTLGDTFEPGQFTQMGVGGSLLLVGVGAAMTVVLQSSSAAVTATLAAVDAGTLSFAQAAALVIGQNVGTTVTAWIGSAGSPVDARRAALAHTGFNLVTGVIALGMLPAFVAGVSAVAHRLGIDDPAISLALFHTAFNLLGVALFVPNTARVERWVSAWIPDRKGSLTHRLVGPQGAVAAVRLESARRTILDIARAASDPAHAETADTLHDAIQAVREWLAPVHAVASTPEQHDKQLAMLHALDHLDRLVTHLPDASSGTTKAAYPVSLSTWQSAFAAWLEDPTPSALTTLHTVAEDTSHAVRDARALVLDRTASGALDVAESQVRLQHLRWAAAHVSHGLGVARHMTHAAPEPADPEATAA